MRFSRFLKRFAVTGDVGNESLSPDFNRTVNADFADCVRQLGGKTFDGGIYRVFRGDKVAEATRAMGDAFPELAQRIAVFGYDWLGRHFAVDSGRLEEKQPLVLMMEPGSERALQVPASIANFHDEELVNYTDDALAAPLYREWKHDHPNEIAPDTCVGYKIPLFLGGEHNVENLEVIELSVYVEICGQLRNKVRHLPEGTTIRKITMGQ